MTWKIEQADAARLPLADQSVDLVFGSPPYCDARSYGIGAQRSAVEWIDWMLGITREACRVSRGLVLWVCAGVTRDWSYWPACEGLLYRWWAEGGQCWRPAYWHRCGIAGSGGRQWLRADVEYVLAFTSHRGAIPWANNVANGKPPKYGPGGEMSHRLSNGQRVITVGGERRGERQRYKAPALANPGNLIQGIPVGGGKLGHKLAHENEAPFPLKLAEWFIRGWCPPGGTVTDPFSGSGTTAHAAFNLGRNAHCFDLRVSQVVLGIRRMADVEKHANDPATTAPEAQDGGAAPEADAEVLAGCAP